MNKDNRRWRQLEIGFFYSLVDGLLPLYVGIVALVTCGVIDDARDMRSTVKLGVQLVVAALMVFWGGRVLGYLGHFPWLGDVNLGWVGVLFTIVAVTGLINAVNMMDGVDGLAGGSVLSVLGWLAFVAALQSQLTLFAVIMTLGTAVLGFLLFNLRHPWRSKANVFMGDAGSMALGFAIAWFIIELSQTPNALVSPVAYGWLVALPVMDTLSLMVRRVRKGFSPFAADRDHLHHIFLRAGFTPGQTTTILMILVATLGGIGIMLSLVGVPDILLLIGLMLLFCWHGIFVARAWKTSKALRRLHIATLGREQGLNIVRSIYFRPNIRVGKGRRKVALFGLYLMAISIGTNPLVSFLGGGLTLAAAALSYPSFWRDVVRLKVFWVSLALTLYLFGRGLVGGELTLSTTAIPWWGLIAISGLFSLPLTWWLAHCRLHWNWLVFAVVLGGGFAFMINANWKLLELGQFASPSAWGPPMQTGFLASLGLIILFAMLFIGLQRLGKGWRPVCQIILALLLIVPCIIVLMGTGHVTAWLATATGACVYLLATPVLKSHQGAGFGRIGIGALLVVFLFGVFAHDLLVAADASLIKRLVEPLQTIGFMLGNNVEQAVSLHAGVVERVTLWTWAWSEFQANWLLGSGEVYSIGGNNNLAGYNDYTSLVAIVASGFGLVGLLGFTLILALHLKALLWANLSHHWHPVWGLGVLSCGIAMLIFNLFSMPLNYPAATVLMVLLTAAIQVASFQYSWAKEVDCQSIKKCS